MLLWRTDKNYHSIVIKSAYLFFCKLEVPSTIAIEDSVTNSTYYFIGKSEKGEMQKAQNFSLFFSPFYFPTASHKLEGNHLALSLFVSSQLKVFTSLDGQLFSVFTFWAFHPQHNLFCGFGLFPENRFGLTSIPTLLSVVPSFSLYVNGVSSFLILGHFMERVFFAVLSFTESLSLFRHVHHFADLVKRDRKSVV